MRVLARDDCSYYLVLCIVLWYYECMSGTPHKIPDDNSVVHKLFLAGAIVILLGYACLVLPYLQGPTFMLIAIILLAIWGRLTSPEGFWMVVVDILDSAISFFLVIFFETYAFVFMKSPFSWRFATDQVLSLIFAAAFYFSARSIVRDIALINAKRSTFATADEVANG